MGYVGIMLIKYEDEDDFDDEEFEEEEEVDEKYCVINDCIFENCKIYCFDLKVYLDV